MLLKKSILISIFTLVAIAGFSQPQRKPLNLIHYDYVRKLRFGFTLGVNVLDFSTVNTLKPVSLTPGGTPIPVRADVVTMRPGFSVNGIMDYRLSSYFNLRFLPGIAFGSRELHFFDENARDNVVLHKMPMASNYIEFPIHLKYSAKRHSNIRPYVIGGINLRSNLSYGYDENEGNYLELNRFEPFYELGVGFDTYFYFFKLSVELKVSKGAEDVLIKRSAAPGYYQYLDVIDKMNSQMIQLSFHFE